MVGHTGIWEEAEQRIGDLLARLLEQLSAREVEPAKSLIRMLDPHGNPRVQALFSITGNPQKQAGAVLHVMRETR